MCIFSLPVLSVGDTEIFARLSGSGTQYLVYQMTYDSEQENAMILPLPLSLPAREDSVQFIDLKDYEGFFDALEVGFPVRPRGGLGCALMTTASKSALDLQVIDVGNYVASVIPSLDDFERLDERFRLPGDVWDQLPEYADFGFVVFQLKEGNCKPHPMAFEFKTRNEKELFFPTVHIHDGQVHDKESFHHLLYMQHAGLDSRAGEYVNADCTDYVTKLVRSDKPAGEFCDIKKARGTLAEDLLLHRKIMIGELENVDYRVTTSGHPTEKSFNWRKVQRWWPVAAAVACVGWFFARRSRLKKRADSV
jgi:hypothetical protein